MSASLITVSDASFQADVLDSAVPVLVDFWAEWCGPCRALTPILDELKTHYGDRLVIAKVNVDQNNNTPAQFEVRSIPTMILFKAGKFHGRQVGLLGKADLVKWLDGLL